MDSESARMKVASYFPVTFNCACIISWHVVGSRLVCLLCIPRNQIVALENVMPKEKEACQRWGFFRHRGALHERPWVSGLHHRESPFQSLSAHGWAASSRPALWPGTSSDVQRCHRGFQGESFQGWIPKKGERQHDKKLAWVNNFLISSPKDQNLFCNVWSVVCNKVYLKLSFILRFITNNQKRGTLLWWEVNLTISWFLSYVAFSVYALLTG